MIRLIKKHKILLIAFIIIVCLVLSKNLFSKHKEIPTSHPVLVVAATVIKKDVPYVITSMGHVEPYDSVSIKAQIDGLIEDILFKEGETVKKGDVLFKIDPRSFILQRKQAEATLLRDQASLENTRTQEIRAKGLLEKGAIAQQSYDQALANRQMAEAMVELDKELLASAALQVEYTDVTSPINGKTGSILIEKGNMVKNNDAPLVVINQIDPIYVSFTVPEKHFAAIQHYAATQKIKINAFISSSDGAIGLEGILDFVDNAIDTMTGSLLVKGVFENKENRLWPGQYVTVSAELYTQKDALLIPKEAIQNGPDGEYVYVIKSDDNIVELRNITTDYSVGDDITVKKGLVLGEKIVKEGHVRLRPGAKIQILTQK